MKNIKYNLDPNWVTGFVDAEGCFYIGIYKRKCSGKLAVMYSFMIKLHIRDLDLLLQIKSFFNNIGNVHIYKDFAVYRVQSRKDLINVIMPHFEKYPLLTEKQNDFIIFKNIVNILEKESLNQDNLIEILKWRISLNKGLSDNIKELYPNLLPMQRPVSLPILNIDYSWFAGFFSGEGCFFIQTYENKELKVGYRVQLKIIVGQHLRDKDLVTKFLNLFNSGWINESKNYTELYLSDFKVIYSKVIPFFKEYKIIGAKLEDFNDFCEAADIINKKLHLTKEGFDKIKAIKSRMNKARY